jgi:hypothetical protein
MDHVWKSRAFLIHRKSPNRDSMGLSGGTILVPVDGSQGGWDQLFGMEQT